MNDTPNSNRTHIAIFGRTNAGKSSIINAIANQNVAIVSDKAGTTTDPVKKAIEINKIGACVIDKEGTLYTAFRRLEQAGQIRSYWGDETSGARRRYYAITEEGRKVFDQHREEWDRAKTMIDALIRREEQ